MYYDLASIGAGNSFLGGFAAGLMVTQGDVVEGTTIGT
jgi:sugar/nucleoside kinase (ribokinase family)